MAPRKALSASMRPPAPVDGCDNFIENGLRCPFLLPESSAALRYGGNAESAERAIGASLSNQRFEPSVMSIKHRKPKSRHAAACNQSSCSTDLTCPTRFLTVQF